MTMQLPDYWLPRPGPAPTDDTRRAFDRLLDAALAQGGNPLIHYTLPTPKWQFLCHLADQRDIALHGSGATDIALFEPRQSNDLNEFGNQQAVYAASDGLWPMFFAIVDRDRYNMTITNACVSLSDPAGRVSGPFYFFSVSHSALAQQAWRTGTVYLLSRATFAAQPPATLGDIQVHIAQLASLAPVVPLARLTIAPHDFPFLHQIRGHDDARLQEYATALQTGAPLPEDKK